MGATTSTKSQLKVPGRAEVKTDITKMNVGITDDLVNALLPLKKLCHNIETLVNGMCAPYVSDDKGNFGFDRNNVTSHPKLPQHNYYLLEFLFISPYQIRLNHTLHHLQLLHSLKSSLQTRLIFKKYRESMYDINNCSCKFQQIQNTSQLFVNNDSENYSTMSDKCLCDTLDPLDGPRLFVEETFCSTHEMFLSDITFSKHGVEWFVSFEEGDDLPDVVSCGNPAFFIKQKTSECLDLSDSLEVIFDDSRDFTSTDLGMDMGIEVEFNFEGSVSDGSSFCFDGSDYDSDSDMYETSEDDDDLLNRRDNVCCGQFSLQLGGYEDENDDCFEIDFVVDEECPWFTNQSEDIDEIVTDSGFSDSSNNDSESTPKSKYHSNCCSPKSTEKMKPNGRVTFASPEKLVTVHRMWAWNHAYRKSRDNYWERYARDRAHFQWRTQRVSEVLEPMLKRKIQDVSERTRQELYASKE